MVVCLKISMKCDPTKMLIVAQVGFILDYNRKLDVLAADSSLPSGLGKATIYGGKYEGDGKGRDLRDLFKVLPYCCVPNIGFVVPLPCPSWV